MLTKVQIFETKEHTAEEAALAPASQETQVLFWTFFCEFWKQSSSAEAEVGAPYPG